MTNDDQTEKDDDHKTTARSKLGLEARQQAFEGVIIERVKTLQQQL